MKPASEQLEIELYFVIDECGAFMWRMNHDMAHGRIPESDHAAIDADIQRVKLQQLEAVRELPRVGVAVPLDADNRGTDEYWTWFRAWDKWKKELTDEEWRLVDAALSRGLSDAELAEYRPNVPAKA